MKENNSIALMIYGEPGSVRDALTEEKYKKLAAHLIEKGSNVDSVLYHDSIAEKLEKELLNYEAILVWVNPIEQGRDRKRLDVLLANLSEQGCVVSAHPDTILKMGTKKILYDVRETEFGGDVKCYNNFKDFKERFLTGVSGIRILKQYRGNGGNGVFKIDTTQIKQNRIVITHAQAGDKEQVLATDDFFSSFSSYFENDGMLFDQEWNQNIINGMVRCYVSGKRVAGFGYQEVNALYPLQKGVYKKPGQRFYYSEDCGLFQDLRWVMENKWIDQVQQITGVKDEMLPVIWDADFFINKLNSENARDKYSLCEINVSSVSPFPESAIPSIAEEVKKRIALTTK